MECEPISLPRGLQIAREMAWKSNEPYLLGSMLMNSGKVISKGFNRYNGTNAIVRKFFNHHTIHAEADALFRAPSNLIRGGTIYVYRTRRDNTPGSAKPCLRCQMMLKEMGIRKAVYSIEMYPYFEEMRFN